MSSSPPLPPLPPLDIAITPIPTTPPSSSLVITKTEHQIKTIHVQPPIPPPPPPSPRSPHIVPPTPVSSPSFTSTTAPSTASVAPRNVVFVDSLEQRQIRKHFAYGQPVLHQTALTFPSLGSRKSTPHHKS